MLEWQASVTDQGPKGSFCLRRVTPGRLRHLAAVGGEMTFNPALNTGRHLLELGSVPCPNVGTISDKVNGGPDRLAQEEEAPRLGRQRPGFVHGEPQPRRAAARRRRPCPVPGPESRSIALLESGWPDQDSFFRDLVVCISPEKLTGRRLR
ncbi:hypothetical protein L345_03003, partial [Ophiophagus hannah]